jgi:hypothetical protein
MKINLFHQIDKEPMTKSMGSVFPVVAPPRADVPKPGEWNRVRILHDWPALRVWINGETTQDNRLDQHVELSRRLHHGATGLLALGYTFQFRNLTITELPSKLNTITLFDSPEDMQKWFVSESNERTPVQFESLGRVLRADRSGHIATKERFRDFELELYIRGAPQHNAGLLFRSAGKGLKDPRQYEIQVHDVLEAHFPTGSLYCLKRSVYPNIRDEEWFLFQFGAKGRTCWVRIDGLLPTRSERTRRRAQWPPKHRKKNCSALHMLGLSGQLGRNVSVRPRLRTSSARVGLRWRSLRALRQRAWSELADEFDRRLHGTPARRRFCIGVARETRLVAAAVLTQRLFGRDVPNRSLCKLDRHRHRKFASFANVQPELNEHLARR